MKPTRRFAKLAAFLLLLFLPTAPLARAGSEADLWRQLVDLEQAGWSEERLEEARQLAIELQSGAVLVVHRDRVVVAWGDVTRAFKMASARKSLVSALYGLHVESGTIDLDETLAELGIDDHAGLTDVERQARVVDLLRARSGIYHPAAYEPSSMKRRRPERSSAAPGEKWLYNNWDFNTLGTIFEQTVGRDLFEEFAAQIATPLGMEDFSLDNTLEFLEPTSSRHPAHLFRMSARDLARFGQLFLQRGRFGDQQILSERWVEESTRIHSPLPDGNPYGAGGYGYLWWIYPAKPNSEVPLERVHSIVARGNGGQVLAILPEGL